jgi:TonB-dependent SusC/RagA subfamily outer membrane receptor
MNPNDIESVTVLKDAVSTAMYGADAGSGVIIITTKSGKKGAANLSFNQGLQQMLSKEKKGLTSDQYKDC